MRCKGNESMCNLVLTSEAYRATESCRRLPSFTRLFNVRLNFALRELDFVPDEHKKVHILLPLACDLNLLITSEASCVVNSCSFMGIILFPYFNSTKGVKKAMASGNSRIRSSISPIRLDCSIRVYLNFAFRKYEKLNNLTPQFFGVYTSRHLTDTYSSFCVIAGGDIFFA